MVHQLGKEKNANNKEEITKQKFCSLKCKTQYDDRYGIDWVEDKKISGIVVLIAIVVIIYFLSK